MSIIKQSPAKFFSLIFVAVLYPDRAAFAYLDPATASIVLQMILGGVAGSLVAIKLYWHRLKELFGHNQSEQSRQVAKAIENPEADK